MRMRDRARAAMRRTPLAATSENATQCACESLCDKLVGSTRTLRGSSLATRCNEAIPACSGSVLRRGRGSLSCCASITFCRSTSPWASVGASGQATYISGSVSASCTCSLSIVSNCLPGGCFTTIIPPYSTSLDKRRESGVGILPMHSDHVEAW